MAIITKIVPEPIIKDYRNDGGSYYEAKCDQCGRIYYPKRSTSKYCSKSCNNMFAQGGILMNPPHKEPVKGDSKVKLTRKEENERIKKSVAKAREIVARKRLLDKLKNKN
jgi:hypothetical protein